MCNRNILIYFISSKVWVVGVNMNCQFKASYMYKLRLHKPVSDWLEMLPNRITALAL